MTLSIQIILFKSLEKLDLCLKSLSLVKRPKDFDLHLYIQKHDEESSSKYKKIIKKYFNENNFTFTENENIGFGKGHNQIFYRNKKKYEDYFMLLNPDTILFFDAFENFLKRLPSLNNPGLIEFRNFPHQHPKEFDKKSFETGWCAATALIINKKAYEEVEGFDDNFFMYGEDVDLSWRIKAEGYKLYQLPDCRLTHANTASSLEEGEEGVSKFSIIKMQAAELYLTEKYSLENQESIDWINNKSEYKDEVLTEFVRMTKNGIPKVTPNKKMFNTDIYKKHRW